MRRIHPVVNFTERPEPGPVRNIQDVLQALLGKIESLCVIVLLWESAGYTVANAATGLGTAIGIGATYVDFGDAGIDQVRVVLRGNNSAAGSVIVTVYDETNGVELCRVTVTGTTPTTYVGEWTTIKPTGLDQGIDARVIGDGAADPIFWNIHLQGRTLAARA